MKSPNKKRAGIFLARFLALFFIVTGTGLLIIDRDPIGILVLCMGLACECIRRCIHIL